jgi:hypothetical protein
VYINEQNNNNTENIFIDPVDILSRKYYLKLKTKILRPHDTIIPVYNFSNLYIQVYKGMTLGKIKEFRKNQQ